MSVLRWTTKLDTETQREMMRGRRSLVRTFPLMVTTDQSLLLWSLQDWRLLRTEEYQPVLPPPSQLSTPDTGDH